jgi:hypothetical protein
LLFFLIFLRGLGRMDLRQTALLATRTAGPTLGLAWALNLVFPGGLLQAYLDLPWPLR